MLKEFIIPGSNGGAQDYIENAVISRRWEVNDLLRCVSSGTSRLFSKTKIADPEMRCVSTGTLGSLWQPRSLMLKRLESPKEHIVYFRNL